MSFKQRFKQLKTDWRNARLRWCKTWLDRAPAAAPAPNPHNLRAILFLRQDGKIGDYIVSSFAFREIKKANPAIKIGVVCSAKNRQLFENNPHIDALHEVRPKSTLSYYQIGKSLAGQYDAVIDPTLSLRPRDLLLLRTLNAKYYVGLNKADYRLFTHNIQNSQQHFADVYAQALRLLGFDRINTQPELPESPASEAAVQDFLQQNGLQNYIALNFFGAANSRRFGLDAIARALTAFQAAFPAQKFILLTYPEITPSLATLCQQHPNATLYPHTQTIHDSIALIRHAQAVLTPDTAIIHIAAALDKPIIGLYRQDAQNYANWYPKSENAQIIWFNQHIQEITPAQMIAALRNIIPTPQKAALPLCPNL